MTQLICGIGTSVSKARVDRFLVAPRNPSNTIFLLCNSTPQLPSEAEVAFGGLRQPRPAFFSARRWVRDRGTRHRPGEKCTETGRRIQTSRFLGSAPPAGLRQRGAPQKASTLGVRAARFELAAPGRSSFGPGECRTRNILVHFSNFFFSSAPRRAAEETPRGSVRSLEPSIPIRNPSALKK